MRLATPDLQNYPCLLTTTVDTTKHYLPSVYPSALSLLSPRTVPNPNQPIKMVLIKNILARNHGKKVGWTRVCNTVKVCFCRAAARRLFERETKLRRGWVNAAPRSFINSSCTYAYCIQSKSIKSHMLSAKPNKTFRIGTTMIRRPAIILTNHLFHSSVFHPSPIPAARVFDKYDSYCTVWMLRGVWRD